MEYRVKYSNGAERGPFDNYELAVANVRDSYPEAEIGHDGDISEGGNRTMCWAKAEDSFNADGQLAVASIWARK